MLVTVTNLTTRRLNTLETLTSPDIGSGTLAAVGGNRTDPIPYPFGHFDFGAAGQSDDHIQLPMHSQDFDWKRSPAKALFAFTKWNQVVQSGVVSFTIASQTTERDVNEKFDHAV